jgi:hypothetical protein
MFIAPAARRAALYYSKFNSTVQHLARNRPAGIIPQKSSRDGGVQAVPAEYTVQRQRDSDIAPIHQCGRQPPATITWLPSFS